MKSKKKSFLKSFNEKIPHAIRKSDFIGKSKKDLLPLLDRTDIQFTINGSGWVTSQTPEAGTEITENMTIELNLE